ncbi:hypothetical protein GCM10008090_13100 [Arenicella chitinivorans]|uniref:Uncharacterized protein n=1 Tax=Arenicella chitinivorans TaxID=1329800 RepID=A0A918VKG7_9GAMM|nr:hypothetical protein [Arenicella chitinivorans]GHA04962.1 hypothetical protein GCM10008090_13100 [Arenicella chitinivorans]
MRNVYFALGLVLLAALLAIYFKPKENTDALPSVLSVGEEDSIVEEPTVVEPQVPPISKFESADSSVANMLLNGDFGRSLNSWKVEEHVTWSPTLGSDSSGALVINAPELSSDSRIIYAKTASQCVALHNGVEFDLDARFQYPEFTAENAHANRINVIWFETPDCSRGGQFGSYAEPKLARGEWQHVSRQGLVPALGAVAARIEIRQTQRGNNNAKAIWDDVVFTMTKSKVTLLEDDIESAQFTRPEGENYVQNSGFDSTISQWWPSPSKRLRWHDSGEPARGGVMSASLPNERDSSMGTGAFNQCINIGSHTRFELGAMVKVSPTSTQRGGGRLRPTWYQGLNCTGRHSTSGKHADVDKDEPGWQTLVVRDLTPKFQATSVRISVIHSIDGRGEHTLWWDDFYFSAY